MLDAYIIEEIKRRERERLQRERARPTLEIPIERDDDDTKHDQGKVPVKRSTVVSFDL